MEPTNKMWIYIGICFAVFVGVVVLFILSKHLKSRLGRKRLSNSKQSTKGVKEYKWTPIRTNLPAREDKVVDGSEEEDSDDQEPINRVEKSKMIEAYPDSEDSE